MIKTKFTEKEIEMLKEMIDFPKVYRLTDTGLTTIKSILKKAEIINSQD